MAIASKRRALLIVNPKARNGKGFSADMRAILERGGISLVEKTAKSDETISDVILGNRDVDLVIVGGGDGTLNAAAKGLMETKLPLAILPLGTANDFARTIGIPADPTEATRQLLNYQQLPIDLGEVSTSTSQASVLVLNWRKNSVPMPRRNGASLAMPSPLAVF